MKSSNNPFDGTVLHILDSHDLIISVGSDSDAKEGDYFAIYSTEPKNVLNSQTGKVLGEVLRPKLRVVITSLSQEFSIASTFEKIEVNVGGSGSLGLASTFASPKWVTTREEIETQESTWEDESAGQVLTGDFVKALTGSDDRGTIITSAT